MHSDGKGGYFAGTGQRTGDTLNGTEQNWTCLHASQYRYEFDLLQGYEADVSSGLALSQSEYTRNVSFVIFGRWQFDPLSTSLTRNFQVSPPHRHVQSPFL